MNWWVVSRQTVSSSGRFLHSLNNPGLVFDHCEAASVRWSRIQRMNRETSLTSLYSLSNPGLYKNKRNKRDSRFRDYGKREEKWGLAVQSRTMNLLWFRDWVRTHRELWASTRLSSFPFGWYGPQIPVLRTRQSHPHTHACTRPAFFILCDMYKFLRWACCYACVSEGVRNYFSFHFLLASRLTFGHHKMVVLPRVWRTKKGKEEINSWVPVCDWCMANKYLFLLSFFMIWPCIMSLRLESLR